MVEINGKQWTFYLVSPEHPMLRRDNGSFALGACYDLVQAIYVNDTLPPVKMKRVICHELAHAAMFSYNIKLTEDEEEIVADLLATYGQEIIEKANLIFSKLKKIRETI